MKDYLINATLAAAVLAIALFYYYGHNFIYRAMANAPSLVQLSGRY